MGSYKKIIQNDSHTNSPVSFPEEEMKFFVVVQDDKEDESRYSGSPYNNKEKECDLMRDCKEEQRSVLTLARQDQPEEVSKPRDISFAQKNTSYHKESREEQPIFSPESREVTQSRVYSKRHETRATHPRVCMDIRRLDTARTVAHQPGEHLEESVPVEIRSVSAIDPEFFQKSSSFFLIRTRNFLLKIRTLLIFQVWK